MINAPHGKEFIFQDGSKARNILELVSIIETLNDHQFHHFVNVHKNDFANWVDHVLSNKHFSDRLRIVSTKSDTIQLIKDEINDSVTRNSVGSHIVHTPKLEDHSKSGHHVDNNLVGEKNVVKNIPTTDVIDSKEEKEEKKAELKAGRQWFKFFSRKRLSEDNIADLEQKNEDKFRVERELKEELKDDSHENALWVVLYIALVVLIITLVMYKLFLSN